MPASRMSSSWCRSIVIATLTTSMAVTAVPAALADADTSVTVTGSSGEILSLEGDGWTTYPSVPLDDSSLRTVELQRTADGSCLYDLSLDLAPTQIAVTFHERAFNPETCVSVIETGTPLDQPVAGVDDAGASYISVPAVDASGALPGGGHLLSAASGKAVSSSGYLKTYYEDPAQIDVNSVRNDTSWTWRTDSIVTPSCVYNVSGNEAYGWYTPSGWEQVGKNWQNTYTCEQSRSSSYSHYRNGKFCFTVDTRTYYDRNTVNGRRDGWLLGSAQAKKTGGCTRLLSFHGTLRRTQN
jgi:hypothetical protein